MTLKTLLRCGAIAFFSTIVFAFKAHASSSSPPISSNTKKLHIYEISRDKMVDQLSGFWLGQSIANWTGLTTEMDKVEAPFYTDEHWGETDKPNIWGNLVEHSETIDFYLELAPKAWGADDDSDIEYMYQYLMEQKKTPRLTASDIRTAWMSHIFTEEQAPNNENYLWVSNERALALMHQGLIPPSTSDPKLNPYTQMIDAQLTTEIFGIFAPTRPDAAIDFAYLPIRTVARDEAAEIAEFYIVMHALAATRQPLETPKDLILRTAHMARKKLTDTAYPAHMFDFVAQAYKASKNKNDWEKVRDEIFNRYQKEGAGGYRYNEPFDAGINYAASLVSLFFGEGNFKRTIQIGTLCGWDSDNPTATWGGLLGYIYGRNNLIALFPDKNISNSYYIHRTRHGFPDRTPNHVGEDTFTQMANRGRALLDIVITKHLGGTINKSNNTWILPKPAELK